MIELPTATGDFGDAPEIEFPDPAPPRGLHVKTIVDGDGQICQAGRRITVDYHGQVWNGDVFDSSYFRGEPATFPIGTGAVIAGWDEALVGKTVGSRLLLSIPPEKAYGERGVPAAGIEPGATLVFVVDIRAVA